ncbi:MAG: hypothetical protein LBD13_04370 [Spirochaetaceae bacterium]|jgi:hypothetical protein|nr:hypothetical protein [Spirochaetaceae bacterium]
MKKMKQRALFMTGLLAAALVFGSVFLGCENEDANTNGGGPQITVPKVDDLPALPVGSTAVASQAEATALLGALEAVSSQIQAAIQTVISAQGGGNFDFTDEAGTKVTVSAKRTFPNYPETVNQNDKINESSEYASKGAVTANTAAGGVTVILGSTFEDKNTGSYNLTVTQAGTMQTAYFNGTASQKNQYVYALTVTGSGNKSARIILDAAETSSATLTNQTGQSATWNSTYTGSLKVYGASAEPKYTLNITNAAQYAKARGYFGNGH